MFDGGDETRAIASANPGCTPGFVFKGYRDRRFAVKGAMGYAVIMAEISEGLATLEAMGEAETQEERLELARRIGVASEPSTVPIQTFLSVRVARLDGAWRLQFLSGSGELLCVLECGDPGEALAHLGEVSTRALILPLCEHGEVAFGDLEEANSN